LKGALIHLAVEGGVLLAAVTGGLVFARAGQPPIVSILAEQRPRETKDRIPAEQRQDMVAGPLALLRAGRAAEADAAARKLVDTAEARGDTMMVADLLTSYGVERFVDGDQDRARDTRSAAIPWLREAVAAARRAWGPDHPETALALTDLGDVLRLVAPNAPGAEAEQALREAYAIRLKTLGPRNVETLASERALADILSAGPPEAGLRPGAAVEVPALYRGAAEGLASRGTAVPAAERLGPWIGLALAEARTGRPAEAMADYERARQALMEEGPDGRRDFRGCFDFVGASHRLAAILKAHGAAEAAQRLTGPGGERLQACFDGRP
jgi:tetratricopeptide (TPR) repeat protein